jgi:hypothetical protein
MSVGGARPPSVSFADEAFAAAANAYARTSENWERAIHAAIADLFDFLADHPAQTTSCLIVDCGVSPQALERRDRLIEHFTQFLRPGFSMSAAPPPPIVGEAIGGGVYEMIRGHVLDRRLDELGAAVPHATVVALSPFIGAARAMRLANSTTVHARS